MYYQEHYSNFNNELQRFLFGNIEKNRKKIEQQLSVDLRIVEDGLIIIGREFLVKITTHLLDQVNELLENKKEIDEQKINYLINELKNNYSIDINSYLDKTIVITDHGKAIKPKSLGQRKYIDLINGNDIVFGMGPAGTGKTYLAMAMAIQALKKQKISRIILTRPAIEAGESLGFLPGDLEEKVDPYLRPIYDALYEILGYNNLLKLKEKGIIEVAPLAYMRGRTLEDAFILLDEAQNTTNEQMKMFLTRIGFGSKAIIAGDESQVDLPKNQESGLVIAEKVLRNISGIGFMHFTPIDIVRHPLVQKIIGAYKTHEKNNFKDLR